jgi:hypothetical protein
MIQVLASEQQRVAMKTAKIELTKQQWQVLEASPLPPRLVAPHSHKAYVIIAADVYERMQRMLEEVDPSLYEFEQMEGRRGTWPSMKQVKEKSQAVNGKSIAI